jgi:hypothetical protein
MTNLLSLIRGSGGERDYEHVRVLTKAVRDGDGVVVTIEQAGRDPDGPTNPFYRLRLSAAGVEEVGRSGKDLSPTTWALRAPFRVGAGWENPDTDGLVGEKYTIAGVDEEVEVPAGRFKAIRLVRGGVQVWMAPGVGTLKWGDGETPSAVLTTFKRGAAR